MGVNTYGKGFTKTMSMKEVRNADSSLPTIIAVDFDGTLVKDKYPLIGEINQPIWDAIIKAQENGGKIILWTSRNGDQLQEAVEFCSSRGLHFDAINENIDEIKILYGGDTRKVFADMYIDDRAAVLYHPLDEFIRIPPYKCSNKKVCTVCGVEYDMGKRACPICKNSGFRLKDN